MLEVSIFHTLRTNTHRIDLNVLLPDVMVSQMRWTLNLPRRWQIIPCIKRLPREPIRTPGGRKKTLAKELNAVDSTSDPELVSAAQSLLALVKRHIRSVFMNGMVLGARLQTKLPDATTDENYLRKVYDKLDVSDRLGLSLHCLHHPLHKKGV
jgi:hypothetical protein